MARPSQAKENLIQAASDLIWEFSYGSTSVDDICARAKVRKGSFYHFFESKAHLTLAAIDAAWLEALPRLNRIFSPLVPPLERFHRYAQSVLESQETCRARIGHVCGCPLSSLGSEVGTLDELIRAKIAGILQHHRHFYESAIRDAASAGLIEDSDASFLASTVQSYIQGAFTQARVLNDLAPIRQLQRALPAILGASPSAGLELQAPLPSPADLRPASPPPPTP